MIKKLLLLLLLIVFVNPIFAQIKQRGIVNNCSLQTNDQLTIENLMACKTGDIMIVTIAQKRAMTVTCFNGVDISCWC
jgi:hypothetical protein